MSRSSDGCKVTCGVETTIQRPIAATAPPGSPSCTPVWSLVVASTASTVATTTCEFVFLMCTDCVNDWPARALSRYQPPLARLEPADGLAARASEVFPDACAGTAKAQHAMN